MNQEEQNLAHIEFETKYRVEDHQLIQFKQIVESTPGEKDFIYVEGPDYYYLRPEWWFKNMPQYDPSGTFVRYRKPSYGLDNGKRQVTKKYKPKDAKNSIKRDERNIDVAKTPEETILGDFENEGLTFNFSIVKNCHIYNFEDATLVFYTVYDTTDGKPKKTDSFMEIEVNEEKIKHMTEQEAWDVITKYEKILEPLGISAKNRLRRSLFEMYKR